jgi:hypothetical protein
MEDGVTFDRDYEALCAAMAFVDAAINQIEDLQADDDCGWSQDLNNIRNAMNDERLVWLRLFGKNIYHVEEIPTPARVDGGEG